MSDRPDRCWFEHCRKPGKSITLDGRHERVLCDQHAGGIREALKHPQTYRISWGMATADKIKLTQERIDYLKHEYPDEPEWDEPARDSPDLTEIDWDTLDWEELSADHLHRSGTPAESAWMEIYGLQDRIEELGSVPWVYPVVRVNVRTADPTPGQARRDPSRH